MASSRWSVARLSSSRSAKASAIATSLTFLSALSAWPAAPVPRPPQPIRPTRITSPPAAWTCAARAPPTRAAVEVFKKSRREEAMSFLLFLVRFLQRVQLEGAKVHLEPLRLQEDLAGGRVGVVALVDDGAVDADGDALAVADAFDAGPLAERALDIVLAAGVDQLL